MLRTAEEGRVAAEEYAKKLEVKFETSARGVALLKAAKLQSELEAMMQEHASLRSVIAKKVGEAEVRWVGDLRYMQPADGAIHFCSSGPPARASRLAQNSREKSSISAKMHLKHSRAQSRSTCMPAPAACQHLPHFECRDVLECQA